MAPSRARMLPPRGWAGLGGGRRRAQYACAGGAAGGRVSRGRPFICLLFIHSSPLCLGAGPRILLPVEGEEGGEEKIKVPASQVGVGVKLAFK